MNAETEKNKETPRQAVPLKPVVICHLTDDQCDEFRKLPLDFNGMVRAIYTAGIGANEINSPDFGIHSFVIHTGDDFIKPADNLPEPGIPVAVRALSGKARGSESIKQSKPSSLSRTVLVMW